MSIVSKKILFDRKIIQNSLPLNMLPEDSLYFERHKEFNLPEAYVYQLKDVNVLSDGTIFDFFKPYQFSFARLDTGFNQKHNIKGLLKLSITWKRVAVPNNTNYLMAHNQFSGYFHWIGETLPRLLALNEDLNKYTLVLPSKFKDPFYKESLELLGIEKIYWLEKETIYKFPNLTFPTQLAPKGNFNSEMIKVVRDAILSKIPESQISGNFEKIYISRSKAPRRKIINEESVIQYLKGKGFTPLVFEDFSFLEQIYICSKAKYFVSIHGAGLGNIMFMQPNGKVLELRKHDKGMNYTFLTLASATKLDYYLQFCESNRPDLIVQDADIIVDMELLEKNIDLMLL